MLKIWKLGNAGITIKVVNNHLYRVSTTTFYIPSTNNYECTVKYSPTLTRIKTDLELCHDFSSYQMKMKSKLQIAPLRKNKFMAAIFHA